MSVLADVLAHLPAMRAEAESLMVDTVTFAAPGTETYDDTTGEYVTTPGATIYNGPCKVQVTDVIPRDATVGEQQVVVERTLIHIPWDAVEVPANSVGEITAVAAGSGSVLGRRYRVIGSHDKSYATATRIPCEVVTP